MSCAGCKKKDAETKKAWRQRTYAWGQFYELQEAFHHFQTQIYEEVNEIGGEEVIGSRGETQIHLNNLIKDLYKKAKEKCECTICLEQIWYEDLETTPCGHTFHKQCIDQVKDSSSYEKKNGRWTNKYYDCPLCRTPISFK